MPCFQRFQFAPFSNGGKIVWDNSNTTSCTSDSSIKTPTDIPGAGGFVTVRGNIKFRDPVTYGNQDYTINSRNKAPTPRGCNGFINGIPTVSVNYNGQRYDFKLDRNVYASCQPLGGHYDVSEIDLNILVPANSTVSLAVSDNGCGEVQPCVSHTGKKDGQSDNITEDWFTVSSHSCFNGIAWSQVPAKNDSDGTPLSFTNSCGYTELCKQDYCDNVPLGVTGNCVAKRRNLPIGFKPCPI